VLPKKINTTDLKTQKKLDRRKMEERSKMDEAKKEKIQKLKEMIQSKKPNEPVEKTLVIFCARNGVSMDSCREYYQSLVDSGEIKET
jgi:hypothetical protein